MSNLENDIKYLTDVLEGKSNGGFDFIYSRSNENLLELFNRINLNGQDVYTVLSSSDFLLSAVHQGAKKVDCFDIMPLTYRYFHLRKWLAKTGSQDAFFYSRESLLKKINSLEVTAKDERDSVLFWQCFCNHINSYCIYDNSLFENILFKILPFKEIVAIGRKLEELEDMIFDNIDICEKIDFDKNRKYDVVYLSNIIDYNRTKLRIEQLILNLLKLLKNDGSIICTHMSQFENFEIEQEMFSKYFDYDEIYFEDNLVQEITYYRYRKK